MVDKHLLDTMDLSPIHSITRKRPALLSPERNLTRRALLSSINDHESEKSIDAQTIFSPAIWRDESDESHPYVKSDSNKSPPKPHYLFSMDDLNDIEAFKKLKSDEISRLQFELNEALKECQRSNIPKGNLNHDSIKDVKQETILDVSEKNGIFAKISPFIDQNNEFEDNSISCKRSEIQHDPSPSEIILNNSLKYDLKTSNDLLLTETQSSQHENHEEMVKNKTILSNPSQVEYDFLKSIPHENVHSNDKNNEVNYTNISISEIDHSDSLSKVPSDFQDESQDLGINP